MPYILLTTVVSVYFRKRPLQAVGIIETDSGVYGKETQCHLHLFTKGYFGILILSHTELMAGNTYGTKSLLTQNMMNYLICFHGTYSK